jgi:hypothetical protein
MAADTGYTRAISEAAREKEWKLPSFAKEPDRGIPVAGHAATAAVGS